MSSITLFTLLDTSAQPTKPEPQSSHTLSIRFPLKPTKVKPINEPYYHSSYPLSSPGVDLILASSDQSSCRFAISSTKLKSFQPELFSRNNRIKTQFDLEFPLVQIDGSKEVIEIILFCLDSTIVPDLSAYTFDDLVSALEAVASRSELVNVERLCLLAIGSYYKTKPVHVFALAEIYGCHWMAKLASEYTLPLNINLPEHKCILSSEAYNALIELHSFRKTKATQILSNLRLPFLLSHTNHHPPNHCSPSNLQKFWSQCLPRLKRLAINSSANLNMKSLFSTEIQKASNTLRCKECVEIITKLGDLAQDEFCRVRSWSLPTSSSSEFSLPTPF